MRLYKIFFLVSLIAFSVTTKAEVGVTDTEIIIGAHTFESGALSAYSAHPRSTTAYFEMINEKGGIYGRKIKFLREDTGGQWQKASAVTKKLIESDKIFAMVGAMGDMHFAAYKELAAAGVPDLFFADAIKAYEPFPNTTFPYSPPYAADGRKLAEFAIKEFKGKRVCSLRAKTVAEDIPDAALESITNYNKKAKKAEQLPIGLDLKIDKTVPQADSEVSQLKSDACDVVILGLYGPLAAKIINYADSQNFRPKWMVNWFNTNSQFVDLLNPTVREGIISTSFLARSEAYNAPGWKDFAALMDKNGIPKTGPAVSGYYTAEAFTELLRRTGKDLTRENLIKTLKGMSGYQCSLCLAPWTIEEGSHWLFKEPVLAIIKNGVWQKMY